MKNRDRRRTGIWLAAVLLVSILLNVSGCATAEHGSEQAGAAQADTAEWFYAHFDEKYRHAYDAFREAAQEPFGTELTKIRDEKGNAVELSISELDSVYQGFLYDHPELFWLSRSYSYRVSSAEQEEFADAVAVISLTESQEEMEERSGEFERAAEELLRCIPEGTEPEETAGRIYDLLVQNTEYTEEALYDPAYQNEHTAYGAIAEKSAVCDGYALAYKYLLGRFGIDCIVIPGESEGAAHVWNTACWDDRWHEMDITWDASSEGGGREYFDLTTDEMDRDHMREADGISLLIPASVK